MVHRQHAPHPPAQVPYLPEPGTNAYGRWKDETTISAHSPALELASGFLNAAAGNPTSGAKVQHQARDRDWNPTAGRSKERL